MHKPYFLMLQKLAQSWSSLRSGLMLCAGLLLFAMPLDLAAQRMWINEFHYDNVGADVGEFVEVVVEAGTDISNVFVEFYNGDTRSPYGSPHLLTTFIAGDTVGCFEIYHKFIPGIQNGGPGQLPDGIVLAHQGVAVEFISYEGTFVAASSVAAGYLSVNVLVDEDNGTGIGFSLQRTGTGMDAGDFTWSGPSTDSPGSINNGQSFSLPSLSASLTDTPQSATEHVSPGDTIKYTTTIQNTGDGDAKNALLNSVFSDPNTTLVPGSFKSTPIAYDFKYNTAIEDAATFAVVLQGFDPDGDMLTYSITDPTDNGSLSTVSPAGATAGTATVQYTPNPEFFGLDSLEYTVTDDDGNMCPAKVYICVQPVNDPPVISCGPNQVVVNTAGSINVTDWLVGFSVGPANESFQSPVITLANDNPSLFSVQPSVNIVTDDLSFAPAGGAFGLANVTATITDGVFTDDANCSFTITVQAAPDAMADNFPTQLDTDLTGEDLFADNGNGIDDLGFPAATISHFGSGSLGGAVTDNTAGSTVALAGGTLQVNANGTMNLTGQPFTVGTYKFAYRLANVAGFDIDTVTIVITPAVSPVVCNADSYTGTGNIAISIPAPGVLANDGGTSPVVTEVAGNAASVGVPTPIGGGGTVTLNADGSFVFEPNAGFEGNVGFSYTINNGFGVPQTCSIELVFSQMIWFIDNAGGGSGGTGTFSDPFKTIADFNSANVGSGIGSDPGPGDFISIADGTYSEADGIKLLNNQTLIGEGVALSSFFTASPNSISSYTTFAGSAGTAPNINPTADDGVEVADGNTLVGFNTDPSEAGIIGNAGGTNGLTVSQVGISNTGTAPGNLEDGIFLTDAEGAISISDVMVIGYTDEGIEINTNGSKVVDVNITNTRIDAGMGSGGTGIFMEAFDTSTMDFNINNNPLIRAVGGPCVSIFSKGTASVDGFVSNNPSLESVANGGGVFVNAQDMSTFVVQIDNNVVQTLNTISPGVAASADVGSTATLDATINSNTINLGNAVQGRGINLLNGNGLQLCANVTNNNVVDGTGVPQIGISIQNNTVATPLQLQGLGAAVSGGGVLGDPTVDAWWTTGGNVTNADAGISFLLGDAIPSVGACAVPTP